MLIYECWCAPGKVDVQTIDKPQRQVWNKMAGKYFLVLDAPLRSKANRMLSLQRQLRGHPFEVDRGWVLSFLAKSPCVPTGCPRSL